MTGYASHDPGVFVVDFALNDLMTEGSVIDGWWNQRLTAFWWFVRHTCQPEAVKDFTLTELVQRLTGQLLQRLAQQNKANITVFCVRTGIGRQGYLQSLQQ